MREYIEICIHLDEGEGELISKTAGLTPSILPVIDERQGLQYLCDECKMNNVNVYESD